MLTPGLMGCFRAVMLADGPEAEASVGGHRPPGDYANPHVSMQMRMRVDRLAPWKLRYLAGGHLAVHPSICYSERS